MSLDVAPAIRDAIMVEASITGMIDQWKGEPSIHTRRPLPDDVTYPCIAISPDIAIDDFDGLTSDRPIVQRDVAVYGRQPEDYRNIETIAYAVRELFHRERQSISPDGYDVVSVEATGPIPGPTDDDKTVARVVGLSIRLRRQS